MELATWRLALANEQSDYDWRNETTGCDIGFRPFH